MKKKDWFTLIAALIMAFAAMFWARHAYAVGKTGGRGGHAVKSGGTHHAKPETVHRPTGAGQNPVIHKGQGGHSGIHPPSGGHSPATTSYDGSRFFMGHGLGGTGR